MPNDQRNTADLLTELTAEIVCAYVSNNPIPASELPNVIANVYQSVGNLNSPKEPPAEPLKLRVPIKKSITDDYIVSLEDGKPYRTLKRHLAGQGLTPDAYRAKWGLPADYPMVAANYAQQRSELAKKVGLGKKSGPGKIGKRQTKE